MLLRVALCMANLTSPKIEDGIAKLITKSDITRLASKQWIALSEECDDVLKDAVDIVALAADAGASGRTRCRPAACSQAPGETLSFVQVMAWWDQRSGAVEKARSQSKTQSSRRQAYMNHSFSASSSSITFST